MPLLCQIWGLQNPHTVFIHPKIDSPCFRTFLLNLYDSWHMIRPSITDHICFRTACQAMLISSHSATKSLES